MLVVAIVFSVPIIAILTSYMLKMKRLDNEREDGDLKHELKSLRLENELLKERVTMLEQIVSDLPMVSKEDCKRLKVNLDEELSSDEIEKLKELDRLNK